MEMMALFTKAGIYLIMTFTLLAAVLAVGVRNIFHAALSLVFALLGVAAIYFTLRAEFLGVMQILLYVGAVMTLLIYVVMLTSRMGDRSISTVNHQRYPALIGTLFLAAALVRLIEKIRFPLASAPSSTDAIQLGKALMGPYVLPFEIVSLVLVIALIGAIVIARSD